MTYPVLLAKGAGVLWARKNWSVELEQFKVSLLIRPEVQTTVITWIRRTLTKLQISTVILWVEDVTKATISKKKYYQQQAT